MSDRTVAIAKLTAKINKMSRSYEIYKAQLDRDESGLGDDHRERNKRFLEGILAEIGRLEDKRAYLRSR